MTLSCPFQMDQEEPSPSGTVVQQLADGSAWFEFVKTEGCGDPDAPFASVSAAFPGLCKKKAPTTPCFARIGGAGGILPARQRSSPASKKNTEHFTVKKVAGDGRCMFRALVLGMAANKGMTLNSYEEEQEADQLRLAVRDAICKGDTQTPKYEVALIAITVEESLKRYCQRIPNSSFWGGESELLVLSRMCLQPISVYVPESEGKRGVQRGGYLQIQEYGSEFRNSAPGRKARKPVRLLFSGSNHYDLLV